MTIPTILLLAASSAAPGPGCIAIAADRILAGHLAARISQFGRLPADTEVEFAPSPGATRWLRSEELRRAAGRLGLDAPSGATWPDVCVKIAATALNERKVRDALGAAIRQAWPALDVAAIDLLDFSRIAVPEGDLEFPRTGLIASQGAMTWRGRVRYGAAGSPRSVPVWARFRLSSPHTVVLASRQIPLGKEIQPDDLRQEVANTPHLGAPPIKDLDMAVGQKARRTIHSGEPILQSMLAAPKLVERGEKVELEVSCGLASLKLPAVAETGGSLGERVMLRNPANGKRIQAVVAGRGRARLFVEHSTEAEGESNAKDLAIPDNVDRGQSAALR